MAFIVNEQVEDYAAEHTTQLDELFERLAAETREKTTAPQMMVGRIEGGFLAALVRLTGAKRILELGTFTGYSSISMASALPPDGRIITCDVDPEATAIARRYMDESGHGDKIEIKLGPALGTISTLEGPFDIVFIDADKPNYEAYYEAVLPLLAENGLVIADNVLWSGRVVEPDGDESTQAIKAFNEHVLGDERVVSVMLTVRDGMTLVQKRSGLLLK
jgi:caffeoyl-CoA O-methyltransferase